METTQTSAGKCSCPCHKIIGLFIALIGLTFLLGGVQCVEPKNHGDRVANPAALNWCEECVQRQVQVLR